MPQRKSPLKTLHKREGARNRSTSANLITQDMSASCNMLHTESRNSKNSVAAIGAKPGGNGHALWQQARNYFESNFLSLYQLMGAAEQLLRPQRYPKQTLVKTIEEILSYQFKKNTQILRHEQGRLDQPGGHQSGSGSFPRFVYDFYHQKYQKQKLAE